MTFSLCIIFNQQFWFQVLQRDSHWLLKLVFSGLRENHFNQVYTESEFYTLYIYF